MKLRLSKIFKIIVYIFAFVGFVFTCVFIGMYFGLFNVPGSNAVRNISLGIPVAPVVQDCTDTTEKTCDWNKTVEWSVLTAAFTKDVPVINKVAQQVGISSSMLVATVAPEQIRFFTSNRESFKKYFEPLKILVSLSKFSLGVAGIKQDTANQIEAYTLDQTSPFYPGPDATALISYPVGADHDTTLFNRLTDTHDHYYSYLYAALFIKEIENQWASAGFDISQNPEVVTTLFNVGFVNSTPNQNPVVGGSSITLGGQTYVYGQLGALVYNSSDIARIFPALPR